MAKVILKDKTKSERKKVSKSQEPFETFKLGKTNVTILGTAHISQKSIDEVQRIIRKEKPDTVCVELCNSRMRSLKDSEHWKKLDIFKVFKERKMYLLLSSLILSAFQKKLGKGSIRPGDEMRMAIHEGERIGAKIVPIDREVSTTLKRAWWNIGIFNRLFLLSALLTSLFVKEDISEEKIEEMKSEDVLKDLFSQLPKRYESIKNVIIDERDSYLAQKIRDSAKEGKKIFVVVGAGHLQGILSHVQEEKDISKLDELPEKTILDRWKGLLIPGIFLGLILTVFYFGGKQQGQEFILRWILVKGGLAALGAIVSLAHPLSVILAFLAAPIGNFNPIIKPGWVAALCESWLRKPLVEDFEKIAQDSEHWKGYWKNNVIRIFLVFMLPQIGSSIGTFIVTADLFRVLRGLM
ncbi:MULTISPECIES: TraB/GumN family protein [Leptospira]|uniref:Pheromone shutdown protein n=1 Tax=Leptospira kirschneri serovar Pomona TaxID=561005 RepID=A0A1T1DTE2_9LEPT|nr:MULTISPECIES: TraB/GumN family protein [Leptospira]EMK04899.1 TraB family protein [Leptospira kirschneri]KXZ24470.1 Pheromone shutdown protein [Leptospira kirschneri]KXZ27803.1 Pheromone shutdown protein [Leptospira sp. ZV016]OOV44087.1 Pheromone shutdown protein [Leptospira kirschneri serovar Pomona]